MRRHSLLLLLLICYSLSEIVDVQDNVPPKQKFGVSQEKKVPTCESRGHKENFAPEINPSGEYDFIVVGGGSAGNVMAARLADSNPDITVLLLESGKNFVDDAEEMSKSMEGIFKAKYCAPHQTADSCPMLSLPLHFSETPFMVPYASASNHSYYYQTTPQLYANKREMNYPRGHQLGGSSATNNLVPFRGHPEDYDHWASLGLDGWSYNDLLPFMKKIETNHDYTDSAVHGTDGPIHLKKSSDFYKFPVGDALLEAAWKLGYPKVEDFNKGHDYYGAGYWQQYSNDKGRRTSSYEYLRRLIKGRRVCIDGLVAEAVMGEQEDLKVPNNPSQRHEKREKCTSKQNLVVITSAFATKLIFDKKGGKPRAIGVEYVNHTEHSYRASRPYPGTFDSEEAKSRHGLQYWKNDERHDAMNCPVNAKLAFDNTRSSEWYIPKYDKAIPSPEIKKVYAKREIILSAGAVGSPQLLMLSGVGPRKHLQNDLGMKDSEIVMNLPGVGRLLDHEEIAMNFKIPTQHWGPLKDLFPETYKWLAGKPSALSSNHIPGGLDTSSDGVKGTKPTIHIHFIMLYFENLDMNHWRNQDAARRVPVGLTDFTFYKGLEHFTTLIERSGSCSEGLLRLKNRDPLVPPLLDMNYASCNFTNQELIFGVREVRKLNEMLPVELRGEEVIPGKDVQTDDEILNWIRNSVWGHHISGSVPLGACDDRDAAADNHGRIYGVEGLRIADASAFPTIPHGNILYSTYTVAERVVQFIIDDNKIQTSQESLVQKSHTKIPAQTNHNSEKKEL